MKLVNRALMTTATTGTGGTITLGAAAAGYQTFADAGVVNGDTVRYTIEDATSWEIGTGTYSSTGPTLTRTVIESSNADAAINLSGNATVFVTAAAEDIQQPLKGYRENILGIYGISATGFESVAINGATADGAHSTAIGFGANTRGLHSAVAIARYGVQVDGSATTTNSTPVTFTVNGASTYIPMSNNSAIVFDALIEARRNVASAYELGSAFRLEGYITRGASAYYTYLWNNNLTVIYDPYGMSVSALADTTNGGLSFSATGHASDTYDWSISVRIF